MNYLKMIIMAVGFLWAYSAAQFPEFDDHVLVTGTGNWGKTGFGDFDDDGHLQGPW